MRSKSALLLLMLVCAFCFESHGLQVDVARRVDSLKRLLPGATGESLYEINYLLAYELFDVENNQAVIYGREAYKRAKALDDKIKIVKSGRQLGQLLRRVGENSAAIETFEHVLPLADSMHLDLESGRITNALALVHLHLGNYDKALRAFYESLRVRSRLTENQNLGSVYINIGLLYYQLSVTDEAIKYYQKSLDSNLSEQDACLALLNLSLCESAVGNYSKALSLLDQYRDRVQSAPDWLQFTEHFAYGIYYLKVAKYPEAKARHLASLALSRKVGDMNYIAENLNFLGAISVQTGDLDDASKYLDEAESLCKDLGLLRVISNVYDNQFLLHKKRGNLVAASTYREKYIAAIGQHRDTNILNRLSVARVEFEEAENKLKIQAQEQLLEVKEQTIVTQKLLNYFAAAFAVTLLVLLGLVYRFWKYQRRISADLDTRIRARTEHLQTAEEKLLKDAAQREEFLKLVSSRINASCSTMSGLITLIQREKGEDSFATRFESVASELKEVHLLMRRAEGDQSAGGS